MLKCGGLYVSDTRWIDSTKIGYFSYLRFYEDGYVIQISSSGNPDQLSTWFHRDNPVLSRGLYQVMEPYRDEREEKLHFAVVSAEGVVGYMGQIIGNQLMLRVYSLINDHSSSQTFSFVAV